MPLQGGPVPGQPHPAERRGRADLRLVIPAAVAWAAAAALVAVPAAAVTVALAASAVLLGSVAVVGAIVVRGRRAGDRRSRLGTAIGVQFALGSAVVVAVAVAVAVVLPLRSPAVLDRVHGSVSASITVTGAVAATQQTDFGGRPSTGIRFAATVTEVRAFGAASSAEIPVLAFSDDDRWSPAIGETLAVRGEFERTDAGDPVAWLVFLDGVPERVSGPPWYLAWSEGLRSGLREAASPLPAPGAGLVPGLAVGDESLLSPRLDDQMTRSGLSHLTAVSGANCAVVVAAIMLLGGLLRLRRSLRVALALLVLLLFVVLVTPQPSVLRAAVMAAIALFSLGASRSARGLPTLCLAVLVLLIADPWLSRSYGFALSALATAGLLVLTAPLGRALGRWLPGWLATALAIPIAAQLACQPVLILLTPSIAPYSVLANLLAEPAAPVATIAGLIACLVGALAPPLATIGAWIAWLPAAWIAAVASFFADAPGAALPWLPGIAGVVAVLVITGLGLFVLFARPGRTARKVVGLGLSVALVGVYGGVLVGGFLGRRVVLPDGWEIAACDIGQGDAVVFRSGDSYGLVDVGPDPALLTHCLDELGIGRLSLLVLTHYDLDHVGGADAVLGRVDTVLVGPPEDGPDTRLVEQLGQGGARIVAARQGDAGVLGAASWRILWPPRGTELRGNDASVTLLFLGRFRTLFLGDLGEDSQRMLMASVRLSHVDIVKVAHHGSADQSAELYRQIRADIGVISVGKDNRYGHPTATALDLLAAAGTAAFRTDLNGLVAIAPGENGYSVWRERADTVVGGSG